MRIFQLGVTTALFVLAGAEFSFSADERIVAVQNLSGTASSGFTMIMGNSGGNLSVSASLVLTAGCPVPAVTVSGDTITVQWANACIQPMETVLMTVRTANGPLSFVSGQWTNSTRINGVSLYKPANPVAGSSFWKTTLQTKLVPLGVEQRSAWEQIEGGQGWFRWVTLPESLTYIRAIRSEYTSRNVRMLGIKRANVATPWVRSQVVASRSHLETSAIRPADYSGANALPILGPVKEFASVGSPWESSSGLGALVRESSDSGASNAAGMDLSQAFLKVAADLRVEGPAPDPAATLDATLLQHANGFLNAAADLNSLLGEIDLILSGAPTASVGVIRPDVMALRDGFGLLGTNTTLGVIQGLGLIAVGLDGLTLHLPLLNSDPRWVRAANLCSIMAAGVHLSANEASLGLLTAESRGRCLWGIQSRLINNMAPLGLALGPNVEVSLDYGNIGWDPSDLAWAQVIIRNNATKVLLDKWSLPVSSAGKVYVPTLGYEAIPQLEGRARVESYVSKRLIWSITNNSSAAIFPMSNGDANGNDFVTASDVGQINSHLGLGGASAASVWSSDINSDGMVTSDDATLSEAMFPSGGTGFFNVRGRAPAGVPIGEELVVDAVNLDTNEALVLPAVVTADGSFEFSLYSYAGYRIGVRGMNWLRQQFAVNFSQNSNPLLNWAAVNGDVDGDNEIGPGDFALLSGRFGVLAGELDYLLAADLDRDGEIGPGDFSTLSANFGVSGD